jgi:hypothetical protein
MNPNNSLNVGHPDNAKHHFVDANKMVPSTMPYSPESFIVADRFVDVNKTISMPKGAEKTGPDFMLTNNQFSKFMGVRP